MKKEELYPIQFLSNIQYRLVDCIFGNNLHYVIQSSAICMDVEVDRLGKIQAEDAHDGFGIDHIAAGDQVEIGIKLRQVVYKRLNFIDGVQRNFNGFHVKVLPVHYIDKLRSYIHTKWTSRKSQEPDCMKIGNA